MLVEGGAEPIRRQLAAERIATPGMGSRNEGGSTLDLTALGTGTFGSVISNFASNSWGVDAIDVEGPGEAGDKLNATVVEIPVVSIVSGVPVVTYEVETLLQVETAGGTPSWTR